MTEFSVSGLKELDRKLNTLSKEMAAKLLRQAASNAVTPIVRHARLKIPVRQEGGLKRTYKGNLVSPGFAKRNIIKASSVKNGRAVVRIGVRAEAFYAVQFVELGTKNMRAQEWLVPAFEEKSGEALERFKDQLRRKIDKATK